MISSLRSGYRSFVPRFSSWLGLGLHRARLNPCDSLVFVIHILHNFSLFARLEPHHAGLLCFGPQATR
jgi:hypothetical protein